MTLQAAQLPPSGCVPDLNVTFVGSYGNKTPLIGDKVKLNVISLLVFANTVYLSSYCGPKITVQLFVFVVIVYTQHVSHPLIPTHGRNRVSIHRKVT